MARAALAVVLEVAAADGVPATALARKGKSSGTAPISRAGREELSELEASRKVKRLRAQRPRTRGDCKDGPRPCPWVSCSMHLAYDLMPESVAVKDNFPGLELEHLKETCALDVADKGPQDLEFIGEVMGLVMERVRQIEEETLGDLRALGEADGWIPHTTEERLYRIQKAPARRHRERAQEAAESRAMERAFAAAGARGGGRAPEDRPCPSCGRVLGWRLDGSGPQRHKTPAGLGCPGNVTRPPA